MADVPTWDSTTDTGPQAQAPAQGVPQTSAPVVKPSGAPTWDTTYDPEERYGTLGQQAIAGLEGFGQGVIGPLAPMAEKYLGVDPKDIAGRAEVNPWTKNIGEVSGLVAPVLLTGGASAGARAAIGAGETAQEIGFLGNLAQHGTLAGAMTDVGNLATKAVGLGELGQTASFGTKVGASVVRQAAETAVMQASDDAAKFVYGDQDAPASAETAISNVGLAAALGGAAGGLWTGAVSPLWKVAGGNKVEEFLKGLKYQINDSGAIKIKDYSGVTPSGIAEVPGTPGAAAKDIPSADLRNVADQYAASKGMQLNHNLPIVTPDPERATSIAKAYDLMQHTPNDPETRNAYNALIKETMDQFQTIKNTGLKIDAIPEGAENPYKNSKAMIDDVRKNNHMWYYPTSSGFGANDALPKNFSMVSAQTGPEFNAAAHDALKQDLLNNKFKVSDTMGTYGTTPERSLMVEHDGSDASKDLINNLGKKYGQESVLHSEAGSGGRYNKIEYSDNHPSVSGFGVDLNPKTAADFTDSPEYGKFSLKFDSPAQNLDHPLLSYTPELINGKPTQANDIFRIVHDYFGHAKEGFGFGPKGEENAWFHHMQMFSPEAQKALASETRGQNSWVNFGPHGAANRANPASTVYADQKAGILPAWTRFTGVKPVTTVAKIPVITKALALEIKKTATDSGTYAATQAAYDETNDPDSAVSQAARALGININPMMKAAMDGDPRAIQLFNELRESQHPEVLAALKDLPEKTTAAVTQHLGVPLEDAAYYSENEGGRELHDIFKKEYNKIYDPVAQAMEARDRVSAPVQVADEARRDFGGSIIEKGMDEVGTDSPYYSTYEHYAQRVMAKDTIGQLDKLKTELYNKASSLGVDKNEKYALNNIRNMISDFQEKQIAQQGVHIGPEGVMGAQELITKRAADNKLYAKFSDMSQTFTDHLGIRDFKGAGTLKNELAKIAPEDLFRKFSPKGNADFIPYLQQYFPETYAKLRELETKKFLAPSVKQIQGETSLDLNKLSKSLERLQKGSPEYAQFVMPEGVQEQVKAAQTINDAVPKIKSSGTAGWIEKLTRHVPSSAGAAIGLLTGHNPVASYLIGEMAQRLGRDVPNEIKLAYLKWLGADKKIDSAAFKSMVDFLHSAYHGEHTLTNAAKNVFKRGAQILAVSQIPDATDRARLDKTMTKIQQNPSAINNVNSSLGHYMPNHQQAVSEASARVSQYLQTIKPKSSQTGPLDDPTPPSSAQKARYNRALDIAQQPNIIMAHIKDGTLQMSDVQDLRSMYPNYYTRMAQKLSAEMTNAANKQEIIPYSTKMSLSLFLGQPLDATMLPASIQATQIALQPQTSPQAPQSQGKKPSQKAGTMMQKGAKSYQTQTQASEADRTGRSD